MAVDAGIVDGLPALLDVGEVIFAALTAGDDHGGPGQGENVSIGRSIRGEGLRELGVSGGDVTVDESQRLDFDMRILPLGRGKEIAQGAVRHVEDIACEQDALDILDRKLTL